MRFSDRETVGPERVYWRQFSSDLRLFTEGLWHAKPQSYGALDTTANEIMTSALSSRRVRSQGREDRMRMSGRTRLRVVGDSGGSGRQGKGEAWRQVSQKWWLFRWTALLCWESRSERGLQGNRPVGRKLREAGGPGPWCWVKHKSQSGSRHWH